MEKNLKEYLNNNFTYIKYNSIESEVYWGIPSKTLVKEDSLDLFNNYYKVTRYNTVKNLAHNTFLEVAWTIIPIIVLLFIALPSMKLLYYMENPLRYTFFSYDCSITIIGHQWFWSYEYISQTGFDSVLDYLNLLDLPDDADFINKYMKFTYFRFDSYILGTKDVIPQLGLRLLDADTSLFLPMNTRLRLFITSDDVIHSWAVPSLGIKTDAIPGRLSLASTVILEKGAFYGQCSEICGIGHGFMPIKVVSF